MIITIDGPAASGKSTVAQALAKKINFQYLNSGFIYRAVAYIVLTEKFDLTQDNINDLANHIQYIYDNNQVKVYYKNLDITSQLKTPIIDEKASKLSTNLCVRKFLLEFQRQFAANKNIVVEGRDSGTAVFPNAEYKFFLTANLSVRASRWQRDQLKRGFNYTQEESEMAIKERDMRDANREIAPLKIPDDACVVDTSKLALDEIVNILFKVICEK